MPVHQAGSYVFKELEALKDVTLEAAKYRRFYRDKLHDNGTLEEVSVVRVHRFGKRIALIGTKKIGLVEILGIKRSKRIMIYGIFV